MEAYSLEIQRNFAVMSDFKVLKVTSISVKLSMIITGNDEIKNM